LIENLTLTNDMMIVLGILGFTVFLFVSEIVRVDVAAIIVMVIVGVVSYFYTPLVEINHLFDGFSSNAVMSIIAVMIIGAGLDKTGLMGTVAAHILRIGGQTEKRIIPLVSGTVAIISSFMQNVGAAALFLPVIGRISNRTGLPMSRLLMPMGFCAILGGTVTMIGSSPLILLNDLILTSNRNLPAGVEQMTTFNLFDVTPVGLALVATGVLYFMYVGNRLLPAVKKKKSEGSTGGTTMSYLRETYGLSGDLFEVEVPAESPLVGKTVEQVEFGTDHKLLIVAMYGNRKRLVSPARDVEIVPNTVIAFIGGSDEIGEFAVRQRVKIRADLSTFADILAPVHAGVAEIVLPPSSKLIGKTMADIRMRKTYGISVLAQHRGGETQRTKLGDIKFQAGDTLIVHTQWEDLARLQKDRNFVVVTTDFPHEELRPHKVNWALVFFLTALGLVLFTDLRLSVALMVGAVGMIISGVLTMDEAYEAGHRHRALDRAADARVARWHADLGPAGGDRRAGDGVHAGDVQRWCDRAAGAVGGQHRAGRRRRSAHFRADRRDLYLEFIPDPNPPGQCADHGTGRLQGRRFHACRWRDDRALPDRRDRDAERRFLVQQ
jgi:di/tricarboxylate transporter